MISLFTIRAQVLDESRGVSEYWIVDPKSEVVRVYRHAEQGFDLPIELRRDRGDTLTTTLLPGLAISLNRLFSN